MKEATITITINGKFLTNGLGEDETGKAIAVGYPGQSGVFESMRGRHEDPPLPAQPGTALACPRDDAPAACHAAGHPADGREHHRRTANALLRSQCRVAALLERSLPARQTL